MIDLFRIDLSVPRAIDKMAGTLNPEFNWRMRDIEKISSFMPSEGAEVSIIPVLSDEPSARVDESELPPDLPILALRNAIVFPGTVFPISIGREKSIKLVEDAYSGNLFIGAVPQMNPAVENPSLRDLSAMGSVCRIIKTFEMPDGTISAVLQGFKRIRIQELTAIEPYLRATVSYVDEQEPSSEDREIKIIAESLKEKASFIVKSSSFAPREAAAAVKSIEGFGFLVNFIATTVELDNFEEKIELLYIDDLRSRAMRLLKLLDKQVELLKLKQEINSKVKTEIDQQQREYYLNSQLRTIQEELGIDEDDDVKRFREQGEKKDWPLKVKERFSKELAKLERFNPSAPEYSIQYSYIQFMLELPWNHVSADKYDLKNAQKILDRDHYGLEKVKERIIEFLAVLSLKKNMKSPILCLYGPPGVGKTSLGKSVAKALGRQYVRISLGGLHDEAEIRGHRRTYVGALPGRILSAIHKAGTSNPVVVLDEVDKIGNDFKGDPSSALLEVLDPEQNTAFHDNYLDIDYDLSRVLFITTANTISGIQPALLDRMELVNITGYLAEEKYEIAKRFLVPKQLEENGLKRREMKIEKAAMVEIIDKYTHESGVRSLEKQIAKLCRVTAKKKALFELYYPTIKPHHLKEYLGLPTAFHDRQKGNEGPGVVTGLAWTAMGGEILFVESSVSEGKGVMSMTGNLGDVMKESATIAYQFIKAHPSLAGISSEEFSKKDIHVHVPEGAVPKDGPSAGITMVSSMVSALRGQAIRSGVAMTGEMTLRGRVLPVGGIKEKILAAKRAGVTSIVISEDNRRDIEDIKPIYIEGLDFVYVKTVEDVVNFIFS